MIATENNAQQVQPAAEPTALRAPAAGSVRESIAEQLARDEAEIARLNQEIERLKSGKTEEAKLPVTDDDLNSAIERLEKKNRASIAQAQGGGKYASPSLDLSLKEQLGFLPDLKADQKKNWSKRRDEMRRQFSAFWKERASIVGALVRQAAKTPNALVRGKINQRKKDNAITGFSFGATKLAKPMKRSGKGKNAAKPAQVAAHVPVAGNATNPLTIT